MRVTDGNITIPLTGNGSVSQGMIATASEIEVGGLNSSLYSAIGAKIVNKDGKPYGYEYEGQIYSEQEMAKIFASVSGGGGGVATKFKMGDVVYRTNVPNFHFGVMSWEEYAKNPTNSTYTRVPIGLVVDPVKRTFVFCELLEKYFATQDAMDEYLSSYTSFDDGKETFERIMGLKGSSVVSSFPVFYDLYNGGGNHSTDVFYVKQNTAFVPALREWEVAYENLCKAFYSDDNSYGSYLDRLIALKTDVEIKSDLFLGKNLVGSNQVFYSQLSTIGKVKSADGSVSTNAFNIAGEMPFWSNAQDNYACCPVFGIYTEEEENA